MPTQMANLSIAKGVSPALILLTTLAALSTILQAAAQPTPPSRCANDQPFDSTNGTCVCNQVTAAARSCRNMRLGTWCIASTIAATSAQVRALGQAYPSLSAERLRQAELSSGDGRRSLYDQRHCSCRTQQRVRHSAGPPASWRRQSVAAACSA
jgi:hypothetical protein